MKFMYHHNHIEKGNDEFPFKTPYTLLVVSLVVNQLWKRIQEKKSLLFTMRKTFDGGSKVINVSFLNSLNESISAYWIDYDGNDVPYGDINPSDTFFQNTYPQHLFIFKKKSPQGSEIFAFRVPKFPQSDNLKVTISEDPSTIPRDESSSLEVASPEIEDERVYTPFKCPSLPSLEVKNQKKIVYPDGNKRLLLTMEEKDIEGWKSVQYETEIKLIVHNDTQETLIPFWIGYDGKFNSQGGPVKAGSNFSSNTFVTHPYVFKSEKSGKFLAGVITKSGIYQNDTVVEFTISVPVTYSFPKIDNDQETSCHDILSKYQHVGWSSLCYPEEQGTALMNELVKYLNDTKKMFIDEAFNPHKIDPQEQWKRAKHLTGKGPILFALGKPTPNDIQQGAVGNCWLMQALSGCATQPDKLVSLFSWFPYQGFLGLYAIKINYKDKWVIMLLDDYFPSKGRGFKYARNCNHSNDIWVHLVEKVYAKLSRSYRMLEGDSANLGGPAWALVTLMGGNARCFEWKDQNSEGYARHQNGTFWKYVQDIITSGRVVVCTTEKNNNGVLVSQQGLVHYHGYSIISLALGVPLGSPTNEKLIPKNLKGKTSIDLICVRNTWGKTEFNGPWSDHSQEWDLFPSVKSALGFSEQSKKDDGVFWMSCDDFLRLFRVIWHN